MSAAEIDVPAERAFAFVQREMGTTRAQLSNRRRQRELVRSRALFTWALRQHRVSYPRIGRALERDHSTVMQLFRVAEELRRVDPGFAARCDRYVAEAGAAS